MSDYRFCLISGCFWAFAHKKTHTTKNTHVKPRSLHESSAAQREKKNPRNVSCEAPECPAPGGPARPAAAPRRPPGASPALPDLFALYVWQRVAVEEKTHGFSSIFSYAQNCFLFPSFFFLWRGLLVLITWLEFTWDKGAKKGGQSRTERCTHSIPWSQSTFVDHGKTRWFLDPVCRMSGGKQGVIVVRNSAAVCVRAGPSWPRSPLLSA